MLKTRYEIGSIPLSEYPRPQMRRESYLCLNGEWSFAKCKREENPAALSLLIKVPFSPETESSGIGNGFVLGDDEKLVYEREFEIDEGIMRDVTLLHFGAVDQEASVWINGERVGAHRGGYTPFCFDISKAVRLGTNRIHVEVTDTTEGSFGARGKQSSRRGGIWYTKQSGIWQTVWIECVPRDYIRELKITPDAQRKTVKLFSDCESAQTVCVFDGERQILSADFSDRQVELSYDFELWSPEHPKLYDFVIKTESGDQIHSYFGVRSFGIGKDGQGIPRLLLNGKPYFLNGVLDQGYWPEGLLTYPCDGAIRDELQMLKDMGFNFIRKHIKIEPLRWYYHCDRLGLVVWQDFVNGGGDYQFTHVAAFPFLGFHHKDNDYRYFAREDEKGREEFIQSVHETVSTLFNCPSIGGWVPFNEGWGQFDSAAITRLTQELDSTRVIDSVSGWHDQGEGKTLLRSLHTYYTPLKVPKDSRPVVLSEFGGYSMRVSGHVFCEDKEFGYKKFRSEEKLVAALRKLYLEKLKPLIAKGLCACVYTQVSDVEEEINGLVTYDRQVIKVPISEMRSINDEITEAASQIE
ncbi:MAG: glycoside hydrolase family 2 [Clostridia bacterium]|nr:glycoside hydrolase family 2 [Clostridia bacterium]